MVIGGCAGKGVVVGGCGEAVSLASGGLVSGVFFTFFSFIGVLESGVEYITSRNA